MLTLSAVSSASIMGTRPYQIDVEIPEATLRSYGLVAGGRRRRSFARETSNCRAGNSKPKARRFCCGQRTKAALAKKSDGCR